MKTFVFHCSYSREGIVRRYRVAARNSSEALNQLPESLRDEMPAILDKITEEEG